MNDDPRQVSFRDYVRVVRERRVLVVVVMLLFTATSLVYSLRQTPRYVAEAALDFQSTNVQTSIIGQVLNDGGVTPEQRAAQAAATLVRKEVVDRAGEINKSPAIKPWLIHATARPEARTHLVIVQAEANTGALAAQVANAMAEAAVDVTRTETREQFEDAAEAQEEILEDIRGERGSAALRLQYESQISRLKELAKTLEPVVLRRSATIPTSPVSPKPVRNTLLGLLVGLTLGLVAAFTRESLDRRFKSSHEITEEMHLPLLGFVDEDVLGRSLVASKGRNTLTEDELEGFRILRTNIEFLDVDKAPKLVLVTSALPEEGKSTISTGLAAAYSRAGKRTLLVEADLRRPTLAPRLGINMAPGLTDYLVGRATPPEVLQTIAMAEPQLNGAGPVQSGGPGGPIVAISAGSPAPQTAELLRSKRCQAFFEQVTEAYDVVIVDSCPLLSVADTLELVPMADAVIVCVRASKTTRDQARAAKAALSHFPDRPTGVVVTGIRSKDEALSYGYYSYGYIYGSAGR